jgi:hypothetical protein
MKTLARNGERGLLMLNPFKILSELKARIFQAFFGNIEISISSLRTPNFSSTKYSSK